MEVRLCDYSPAGNREVQALCGEIQGQLDRGACRLVDLLDGRQDRTPESLEVFRYREGAWWTRQYVGLFQYRGERVVIGSRFDRENREPFFLRYLIEEFLEESLLVLEDVGGVWQDDPFDMLLAVKLAVQLQQAWKKGGLRAYRSFCHNDSRVRGQIDVSRHIRENLGQDNGRTAYRTRAYSLNSDMNVLFLQAAEAARRRYPSLMRRLERRLPEFHTALAALGQAVPDWAVPRRDSVLERTRKKLTNPIYRDYEAARRAARAVLSRMGVDPFGQGERGAVVTGVFLDMDRLWERTLEHTLFQGVRGPYTQQSHPLLDGHMVIRPDFYFRSQRMVLDAKYRSAWARTVGLGGKWSDELSPEQQSAVRENVYQVMSYMLALDCQEGGVIFPVSGRDRCLPRGDRAAPGGRKFWRIPVNIPRAENYPIFRRELEETLGRLRELEPICRCLT